MTIHLVWMIRKEIKECVECKSQYYADVSAMQELCPECAHYLYGYENCDHHFENGRCIRCYWDGNVSDYIKGLRENTGMGGKLR